MSIERAVIGGIVSYSPNQQKSTRMGAFSKVCSAVKRISLCVVAGIASDFGFAADDHFVFLTNDLFFAEIASELEADLAHAHFLDAGVAYLDSVCIVSHLIDNERGCSAMLAVEAGAGAKGYG